MFLFVNENLGILFLRNVFLELLELMERAMAEELFSYFSVLKGEATTSINSTSYIPVSSSDLSYFEELRKDGGYSTILTTTVSYYGLLKS